MSHVILLGDSTLDNAAYVGGGPAVVDQVRGLLPDGWRATLLAVDGSRIEDVHRQLRRLPDDASHLVLSVGGNDLLAAASVLGRPTGTVGQGMLMLADLRDRFAADYAGLLRALAETGLPTVVCTVYEPPFPDATLRCAAVAALSLFDDAIVRAARPAGVPVLELRGLLGGRRLRQPDRAVGRRRREDRPVALRGHPPPRLRRPADGPLSLVRAGSSIDQDAGRSDHGRELARPSLVAAAAR